jgi:hypothetical protein
MCSRRCAQFCDCIVVGRRCISELLLELINAAQCSVLELSLYSELLLLPPFRFVQFCRLFGAELSLQLFKFKFGGGGAIFCVRAGGQLRPPLGKRLR